jgi:hypothetical protein
MGAGKSFIVHFQATTYVNECLWAEGKDSALVANRYSQYHELNQDYGLTIVTEGTAYFRTDRLWTVGVNPDALRPYMVLPIPLGYKRETVKVQGSSDGSSVDVQKSDQFVAGQEIGASRIELNYREALQSDPDLLQTAMDGIDKYFQIKWWNSNTQTKEVTGDPTPKLGPKATDRKIRSRDKDIKKGGFGKTGGTP